MFIVALYVSKPEIFSRDNEIARTEIEMRIAEYFGGFTRIDAKGCWLNPETEKLVFDEVDKYEILTELNKREIIIDIVKSFKNAYGQESLPYSIVDSSNYFV